MPNLLNGRYERRQPIGVGGFGVVEQYEDKANGNLVAIKTILAKHVNGESLRLLREIDIMLQLSNRHPRVVSVFDVFCTPANSREQETHSSSQNDSDFADDTPPLAESPTNNDIPPPPSGNDPTAAASAAATGAATSGSSSLQRSASRVQLDETMDFNVHIVMPLMRGDLHRYTREGLPAFPHKNQFEQAVAVVFAFHLVFGVDFIHKCGIVHRDLKPENILISLDMASPYDSNALIADFGLARDVRSTETFYVCTRHYRPPEVITNSAAMSLSAIDVWSVGCILFELVTGKFLVRLPTSLNEAGQWEPVRASMQLEAMLGIIGTPLPEDVEQYIDAGRHANIKSYLLKSQPRPSRVADLVRKYWRLAGVSVDEQNMWIDVISSCVRFFPQQRPTAEQLCCHPLFRHYNVYYGQNINQYPTHQYEPVETSTNRVANKGKILELIEKLGREARASHTPPPASRGAGDDGDAPPPAEEVSQVTQSATAAIRAPHVTLPDTISDPDLRARFSTLNASHSAEVQSMMDAVLVELEDADQSGHQDRQTQLRHLLSFLVALIPQHSSAGDTTEEHAAI